MCIWLRTVVAFDTPLSHTDNGVEKYLLAK